MKHGKYPLNIQLFAEGTGGSASAPGQGAQTASTAANTAAPPAEPGAGEKQFTQADIDRIIAERLERQQKKFESTLEERLSEAQKLAKMNAEQKAQYEREQAEQKLREREQDITRRELIAQAKEGLASKGLPLELAGCGVYTDAESCQRSLGAVEKAFQAAVEKAVNDRLRGTPPKAPEPGKPAGGAGFMDAVLKNQSKRN